MDLKRVILALAVIAVCVGAFFAGGTVLEDYSTAEYEQGIQSAVEQSEAEAKEQLETELETLRESLEEEIGDLKEDKASLEAQLEEAPDASTVEELELKIEELQAEIASREQTAQTVGELIDDLQLSQTVDFSVDDSDVEHLFDGDIEFDEEDYDAHEEFVSNPGDILVAISLTEDEEFGASPYLSLLDRGALTYRYVFDDAIEVADISADEPLRIMFLGQEMEIVSVDASEIKVRTGEEHFLAEGDSVELSGKTITLQAVADGKAYVEVDGETKIIDESDSKMVNGIDVLVKDTLDSDRAAFATLILGDEAEYIQEHGDDYFDREDFKFSIELQNSGAELKSLSVSYDERRDDLDDEYAPLAEGESLSFPNDYISLKFHEVEHDEYIDFRFEFEEFDDELENGSLVDVKAVRISTDSDRNLEADGESVTELFVSESGDVFYADDGDWYQTSLGAVELLNDDSKYTLDILSGKLNIIESLTGETIELDTDFSNEKLGADEDDAEASDIKVNGDSIGTREYDVLTLYGTVIPVPESLADSDEFAFRAPSERVMASVLIS